MIPRLKTRALERENAKLRRQLVYANKRLADAFRNERRNWLGEIRSIVHAKGYVMVRRPGRTTHVVSQREWDRFAPFPEKEAR